MTMDKTEIIALASLADETAHGHDQSGHVSPVGFVLRKCAATLRLAAGASAGAVSGKPVADWRDDPTQDERWNAGCDFAMTQLCKALDVDPASVNWDAATETVDGDVQSVIWNILRARMGEDWDPDALTPEPAKAGDEVMRALKLALDHIDHMSMRIARWNDWLNNGRPAPPPGAYSFESLGEDMPGMKAALSTTAPQPDNGARDGDPLAGKVPCYCHDPLSQRLCLDKDRCYTIEAQGGIITAAQMDAIEQAAIAGKPLAVLPSDTAPAEPVVLTDDQIKHMVDRFLGWKLPEHFNPDCGISFKWTHSEQSQWGPQKYEPIGTNLFDAIQATEMVRHIVEGLPAHPPRSVDVEAMSDRQTFERIIASLHYDGSDTDSLTVGEIRRAL